MRPMRMVFLFMLILMAAPSWAAPIPGLADEVTEWDVDGLEPLLPRHESVAEQNFYLEHPELLMSRTQRDDTPPVGPVRNCGEWEPTTGVLVRYPLGLPYNLLRDFDDDVTIYVVVSSSYQNTARTNLENNGVDLDKVEFVVRNNDSIWTRDYGPWFVFDGAGDIGIVDHTYNRAHRPNDNLIPVYLGQQIGVPVYSHSMYHTGGNYMTDGQHISASTRLVYAEASSYQGMNAAEVDQLMLDYYGVQNYQVLDYIESGGIHHIDTWAKWLDEETVLVKDVWESHWTYDELNQRATLLASLEASTGRNYKVFRVYCYNIGGSSPASYTNSLMLNDNIYVPTFGNSTNDEAALAVYREAAPGYNVRGYYYSGFLSDDALHCRTKGIMDAGMLRVHHVPVIEDQPAQDVAIAAHIRPHSGDELTSAVLHWRHGTGSWNDTDLVAAGEDWQYAATIPAPAATDSCHYWIEASDGSGRTESSPRVSPAMWNSFRHEGGTTAVGNNTPSSVALNGNYPNPFNPSTTFSFALAHADHARLVVIDARGRLVRTLVDGTCQAGTTEVIWNGTDDAGRSVPSGTYFYRLQAAGLQYTKAASLIK